MVLRIRYVESGFNRIKFRTVTNSWNVDLLQKTEDIRVNALVRIHGKNDFAEESKKFCWI